MGARDSRVQRVSCVLPKSKRTKLSQQTKQPANQPTSSNIIQHRPPSCIINHPPSTIRFIVIHVPRSVNHHPSSSIIISTATTGATVKCWAMDHGGSSSRGKTTSCIWCISPYVTILLCLVLFVFVQYYIRYLSHSFITSLYFLSAY